MSQVNINMTDALELRNSGADYLMLDQYEIALKYFVKSLKYEQYNTLASGLVIDTFCTLNPHINILHMTKSQLDSLNLNSDWIRYARLPAFTLAAALESLTSLNLTQNQIGDAGAAALAKALESNSSLTSLNLEHNLISEMGAMDLAKALESNLSLTILNLTQNQIGDTGAAALAKALVSNLSLTSLSLERNQIGHTGASALAKALESNSSLTSLNLDHNQIGDTGTTVLAKFLESNSSLTCLNLNHNQIGHTGASALAKTLESNSSLTSLNLDHNQIGDTGATVLAKSLESNSFLTSLNLNHNQIGDAGATALAKALKSNLYLTFLNLVWKQIGGSNSSLTSLNLTHNQIGNTGAIALAKALESNSSLISLNVQYNVIGDTGAVALAKALKSNSSLISLNLTHNQIGHTGATALVKALDSNLFRIFLNFENKQTFLANICPAAWIESIPAELKPTKEQYEEAKSMLKDPDGLLYHFAVAGHAGTGKSSLINALRGCRDKDKGAAKVGVAETTMAIKQYPDTNSVLNKFVWYDIPGAGTQANRVEQYVIDKGLFVFDFIIICWKDRIMETDMQILNSCKIWKIPTFLVRTNSQTHINNLKLSEDITEKEATDMLKNETHETVKRNLREGNYNELNKKVYIIDKHILGKIVSSFTKKLYSVEDFTKSHLIRNYNITEDDIWTVVNAEGIIVIDEVDFLKDLLETVNMKEQQCLIVRN